MPLYGQTTSAGRSRISSLFGGGAEGAPNPVGAAAEEQATARRFDLTAQVGSEQAQVSVQENRDYAQRTLDRLEAAGITSGGDWERLQQIVQYGQEQKVPWYLRALQWLDKPGALVRYAVADWTQADEEQRSEITGQDYLDILLGRTASIRERHPASLIGEDARMSGSQLLTLAGYEKTPGVAASILRGLASFGTEVVLDPISYLTGGGGAASKKGLLAGGAQVAKREFDEAFSLVMRYGPRNAARHAQGATVSHVDDLVRRQPAIEQQLIATLNREAGDIGEFALAEGMADATSHSWLLARRAAEDATVDRWGPRLVGRDWGHADLADLVTSKYTPAYMRGGLRVSPLPLLGQRQSRALSVPGTRGLGRKVTSVLFGKPAIAGEKSTWIRHWIEQGLGPWYRAGERAREGLAHESWIMRGLKTGDLKASTAAAVETYGRTVREQFGGAKVIGVLAKQVLILRKIGEEEGLSGQALFKLLDSVPMRTLEQIPRGAADAAVQADVLLRAAGVESERLRRGITEFMFTWSKLAEDMHGTAVGMRLLPREAKLEDYIAMVRAPGTDQLLADLSEVGVKSLDMTRMGDQLVAEVLAGTRVRRLTGGVLGEAGHAQERTLGAFIATPISSTSTTELVQWRPLLEALEAASPDEYAALMLRVGGEAIAAGGRPSMRLISELNDLMSPVVERLAREHGIRLPKLAVGQERFRLFDENLLTVATAYLTDMSDAIVERKIVQFLIERGELAVVGGTVHGHRTAWRLAQEFQGNSREMLAELHKISLDLERGVAAEKLAARKTMPIKVGGRSYDVPVEGVTEAWKERIRTRLAVLDSADRLARKTADDVARLKVRLVKRGLPEDVAELLAQAGSLGDARRLWREVRAGERERLEQAFGEMVEAAQRGGQSEAQILELARQFDAHVDWLRSEMRRVGDDLDRRLRPGLHRNTTRVAVTGEVLDEAVAAGERLRPTLDAAGVADQEALGVWAVAHKAGLADPPSDVTAVERGLRQALGLPESARITWGTAAATGDVRVPFIRVAEKPLGVTRTQVVRQLREAGLTAEEARAALLAGGDLPAEVAALSEQARWTLLHLDDEGLALLEDYTAAAGRLAAARRRHTYTPAAIDSLVQPDHFTIVGAKRFEGAISKARALPEGTLLPAGADEATGLEAIRRAVADPAARTIGDTVEQPARARLVEEGTRLFLTEDGRAGFAIDRDGQMFGLFNWGERGADLSAVARARQEGALIAGLGDLAAARRTLRQHGEATRLLSEATALGEKGRWEEVGVLLAKNSRVLRHQYHDQYDLLVEHVSLRRFLADPDTPEEIRQVALARQQMMRANVNAQRADESLHLMGRQITEKLGDPEVAGNAVLQQHLGEALRLRDLIARLRGTMEGGLPFPEDPELVKKMFGEARDLAHKLGWTRFAKAVEGMPETVRLPPPGRIMTRAFALSGEVLEMTAATPSVGLYLEGIVSQVQLLNTPVGLRFLAHQSRSVVEWWKMMATVARPTFHIRNLVGGVWNNMIGGVRMQDYLWVRDRFIRIRAMTVSKKNPLTLSEAIATFPEKDRLVLRGMQAQGILSTSFAQSDLAMGRISRSLRPPASGVGERASRLNPLSASGPLAEAGGWGMQTVEDFLRAACFHRWYDEMGPEVAREWVFALHFDYQNLTHFETQIKKVVPFFVWTRRNIPLQLRALVERPDLFAKYQHLMHGFNDQYTPDQPYDMPMANSYTNGLFIGTGMIFNPNTPFWARAIISPDLPLNDLGRVDPLSPASWLDFVANTLGPHVTLPFMLREAEEQGGSVNAPAGLNQILLGLHALGIYGDAANGVATVPRPVRTLLETAIPPLSEYLRPLDTDPARRQALGLGPDASAADVARAYALQLARGVGVRTVTPTQTYNESFRVNDEIYQIVSQLQKRGVLPPQED